MNKSNVVYFILLSLGATSVFAGPPDVVVSEPSTLALIGGGVLAVIYLAKKFKK